MGVDHIVCMMKVTPIHRNHWKLLVVFMNEQFNVTTHWNHEHYEIKKEEDPLRNVVWSNSLKHTKTCSFHMKPKIEII
jgi:hypothetical protein